MVCVDTDALHRAADDVAAAARELEALHADRGMSGGADALLGSLLASAPTAVGAELDRLLKAAARGWQGWVTEVQAGGDRYLAAEGAAAARHDRLRGGVSDSSPRPV